MDYTLLYQENVSMLSRLVTRLNKIMSILIYEKWVRDIPWQFTCSPMHFVTVTETCAGQTYILTAGDKFGVSIDLYYTYIFANIQQLCENTDIHIYI